MPEVARQGDKTACPVLFILPHVGGPLEPAGAVTLTADGKDVIRIGDYAHCRAPNPLDVVFEGAACFTVCGIPVARKGDHMAHGGLIVEGSPTFIVGGPTWALPANITISGPADFQNKTIRDMYMLSTLPSGQEMLNQLTANGKPVSIEPESDPHNSFCAPGFPWWDSQNGVGTGSTVKYNPDVAIWMYDDKWNEIGSPPQLVLGHELIHALHNSDGTNQGTDPDPNAPASEPTIPKEEAYTIGTGSWDGTSPTENSMRSDLGLPRRDNHYGTDGLKREERQFLWFKWTEVTDRTNEVTAPTGDLRPGNC